MLALTRFRSTRAGGILSLRDGRVVEWGFVSAEEAPRPERWRLVAWLVLAVAFAALAYAGQLAGDEPPDDYAYRYSSSISAVVVYAFVLGIVFFIAYGLDRRTAFGLRPPESWPRALGYALLALVAIYVTTYVYVTATGTDPSEEQGLVPTDWNASKVVPFVLFFLSVSFVAPIAEELTYRGIGYSLLVPYGTWTAILVTGVLFGLAHGLLEALPILAAFGIALGWLRARTSSIYPCMALHGFFNAIAVIVSVSG
jgi:CAAX protease family protein